MPQIHHPYYLFKWKLNKFNAVWVEFHYNKFPINLNFKKITAYRDLMPIQSDVQWSFSRRN